MNARELEKDLEKEFHVSTYIIIYKLVTGAIELLIGISIFFLGNNIVAFYQHFKTREILEDPHDLVVNLTERILPYFLTHRGYVILILVALGIVKIVGAIGLYHRKNWGLDLLIAVVVILLPFDIWDLVTHPTFLRTTYLAINVFIALYLVNFKPKEYMIKLHRRARKNFSKKTG